MFAAQKPRAADPAGGCRRSPAEGQRKADGLVESLLENFRKAGAFLLVFQPGFNGFTLTGSRRSFHR